MHKRLGLADPLQEAWRGKALRGHVEQPHPARDGMGGSLPFDAARHDAFQQLMETFGDTENLAIKRRKLYTFSDAPTPPNIRLYVQLHAGIAKGKTVKVDKGTFDLKDLNPRGAKKRPSK